MKRRILLPVNEHQTAEEVIREAFGGSPKMTPSDTAKFVFHWENSETVAEMVTRYPDLKSIDVALGVAEFVRKVEDIPLRELPRERLY